MDLLEREPEYLYMDYLADFGVMVEFIVLTHERRVLIKSVY